MEVLIHLWKVLTGGTEKSAPQRWKQFPALGEHSSGKGETGHKGKDLHFILGVRSGGQDRS